MTWRATSVAELRLGREAALLGGDIAGTGPVGGLRLPKVLKNMI
jgi:hypothetical protein